MLDNHPVLKDRLLACAVFSGIAIGGISGFNTVITGGFDFLTPGREIVRAAPSSYETVVDGNWFERPQVIPMHSTEPLFSGEVTAVSEDLAGAADDATVPVAHRQYASEDGGDAMYRQLAARYDNQATAEAQDVQPAVAQVAKPDDDAASFNAIEDQMRQALPDALVSDK